MSKINKKSSLQAVIFVLILCLIAVTCRSKIEFVIVPIREAEFREEKYLPLDTSKIEEIVEFIADGGVHKDDGFQAGIEYEPFRRLLAIFTKDSNLTYGAFKELLELREFIDPESPIRDVIDAREDKAPQGINRLGYRYKDFWFVFMVDKLFEDGKPILDNERKFSRLIVMKVLDIAEKVK